jgi:hypothetical protein
LEVTALSASSNDANTDGESNRGEQNHRIPFRLTNAAV